VKVAAWHLLPSWWISSSLKSYNQEGQCILVSAEIPATGNMDRLQMKGWMVLGTSRTKRKCFSCDLNKR
jgi:hypothetical protein